MSDLIGQSLGRYHILEQLGEGGMATVYKAFDTRLERDVAVKIIRVDKFGRLDIDGILKRFEREAKALARLTHPNIVHVNDYGEHEGIPYLVMDFLPGGTLKERMRSAVTWQAATRLIIPVASALDYAHQNKIIHRDVKPANILLTASGQPMLTDFGIAKILESEAGQTLTGTGVGIGTPEYMAPEQGMGRKVDGRADIYSLGIVFYELVTGRKPYTADTPMAVVFKHISDPLPDPRQFVPNLPENIARVIFKALAKNPDDRYEEMSSFLSALENSMAPSDGSPLAPAATDASVTLDEFEVPQVHPTRNEVPKPAALAHQAKTVMENGSPKKPSVMRYWPVGLIGIAILLLGTFLIGRMATFGATVTQTAIVLAATDTPTDIPTDIPTNTPTEMPAPSPTPLVRQADKMAMVYVPAGSFMMGSDKNSYEKPVHQVTLSAYRIDQTEVTNEKYELCVQTGICSAPSDKTSKTQSSYYGDANFAAYPVINVKWSQAKTYCEWVGMRLPTEAEWEKAARGTDDRTYPWGEGIDITRANYNGTDTRAVGSYPSGASPYGALDMASNVWEWVADWYRPYPSGSANDPKGPETGDSRILRGGSWNNNYDNARSAYRDWFAPGYSSYNLGFRCARGVAQ